MQFCYYLPRLVLPKVAPRYTSSARVATSPQERASRESSPLAGHVPEILAAQGGRAWLIQVLLWGMSGEITVKGVKYNGVMPGYRQLGDAEIAALLNHISTQWGNKLPAGQKPFSATEVQAQRAKTMTAAQVNVARKALGLK